MFSFFKLTCWAVFWFILWVLVLPFRKGRGNCLTYALDKWDEEPDSYLVIRWCRSNKLSWFKWPHFLWLDKEHHFYMQHTIPAREEEGTKHYLPQPWFEMKVKQGDFTEEQRQEIAEDYLEN